MKTTRSSYRTKILQRHDEQKVEQQRFLNQTEPSNGNTNNNNNNNNNKSNNEPVRTRNNNNNLISSITSLICMTFIVCILFVWNQNQYEERKQRKLLTRNEKSYNYDLLLDKQQEPITYIANFNKVVTSTSSSLLNSLSLLSSSLRMTTTVTEKDTHDNDDEFYQVTDNNNSNNNHRLLVSTSTTDSNNNNINNNELDDENEDEICRTYLNNFLNSTNTDITITCTEYNRAYTVADCSSSTSIMYEKERSTNINNINGGSNSWWVQRNTTDHGDVGLDDAYQTKQCCIVISNFIYEHCTSSSSNSTSGTASPTSSPKGSPTTTNSSSVSSSIDVLKLLSIITVLLVCGIVKSLLRYMNIQFIPDAGACIIVGIIVAAILNILNIHSNDPEQRLLSFDNDLFLRIMLPPIIFEAALSIDKKAFVTNIYKIVLFSTVGTVMSAIIVGYGTYYISNNLWKRGIELPLIDSLLYGSLMSSIDPVATLSILSNAGVHPSHPLYILIFGESLLNDGIAIVLFDSLIEHMGDSSNSTSNFTSGTTVFTILGDFFLISIGSILIGYICGCCATIYFWLLRNKQNDVTEVSLFFAWALVPYYIADGLKYSGIISIMVMGFMMDYYVIGGCFTSASSSSTNGSSLHEYRAGLLNNTHDMHNNGSGGPTVDDYMTSTTGTTTIYTSSTMEGYYYKIRGICKKAFSGTGHFKKRSQHHVGFVAEVITAIMETAIFAYLGLFLFHDRDFNFKLIISALFSCIVSRGSMVVILSLLINTCLLLNVQTTLVSILTKIMNLVRRNNNSNANHRYSAVDNNDENNTISNDTTQNGPQRQRINKKQYLTAKTQMILFSAGIRGAVSYALVQNIPMYDDTTKTGSHYKGELRTMTSVTIIILMFGFGAVTYFIVNVNNTEDDNDDILQIPINDNDTNNDNNHYRQRLLPHGHQDSLDDSNDPSLNPSIVVQQQYQLMNNNNTNNNNTNNNMTTMNPNNFAGPPASAFTNGWGNVVANSGMNASINTNNNDNAMTMMAASSVVTNNSLLLEASIEEQQHRLMYNQQQPVQEVWQQQQQQE